MASSLRTHAIKSGTLVQKTAATPVKSRQRGASFLRRKVAINVPAEKARAVVDAAEQELIATLATKSDLQGVRSELKSELQALRSEIATQSALFQKDMQLLESRMTTKLGSVMVVAMGLLFAALKLT